MRISKVSTKSLFSKGMGFLCLFQRGAVHIGFYVPVDVGGVRELGVTNCDLKKRPAHQVSSLCLHGAWNIDAVKCFK